MGEMLSHFAFNFNLRRYMKGDCFLEMKRVPFDRRMESQAPPRPPDERSTLVMLESMDSTGQGGCSEQPLERRREHDVRSGWMLIQTHRARFVVAIPSYEHVPSGRILGFRPFNGGRVVVVNDPAAWWRFSFLDAILERFPPPLATALSPDFLLAADEIWQGRH